MYRDKINNLFKWKISSNRKPLVLKGARQVGKTWLVRELGKSFQSYIEINFEMSPHYSSIFQYDLNPKRILNEILDATGKQYEPGDTLLFFDEAQESLSAIKSLRYFYEELPKLHVICTGSLLDFVLEQIPTGVGRITYLDLYPMTFSEFLIAMGEERLRKKIQMQSFDEPFLEIHHQKLLQLLHKYFLIGGMPEAINEYITSENFRHTQQVQLDLIRTFQDDFIKYGKTHQIKYLDLLLRGIPLQLGTKFIYSHLSDNIRSRDVLPALELLEKARIIYKIIHSKADGLPLHARINPKQFKTILLDIGLTQNILGIDLEDWVTGGPYKHIKGGALAETFVGQELAAYTNASINNPLTYWQRDTRGSSAELDFLLERAGKILPIEVKEGPFGRMKSLHLFMKEKGVKRGLKLSSFGFSYDKNIQSIPLYAVERLFV